MLFGKQTKARLMSLGPGQHGFGDGLTVRLSLEGNLDSIVLMLASARGRR